MKIVSARISEDILDSLKESTGKDNTDLVKEGLSLLADKYINRSEDRLFELMDKIFIQSKLIASKIEKGENTKKDKVILNFYDKVWEMYRKIEDSLNI